MSDFIVRFQGIELSKEHEQQVQAAIQKAVVAEISSSSLSAYTPDPDGTSGGHILYWPPRHWMGIIYGPVEELRTVAAVSQTKLTVNQEPVR